MLCKPVGISEAEELLADARTLRRRARADRHAHWLPLLFFGAAIAAAAPAYVGPAVAGGADEVSVYYESVPRFEPYWVAVLLAGALLTAWCYRYRGRRMGIEGRLRPPLVAAAVVLVGYLVLTTVPGTPAVGPPIWIQDFTFLLVLAVGLLALAAQERSRELGLTAALFGLAAVLANGYDVTPLVARVGIDVPVRAHQLPNLLLPAAVLLAGGAVAGVRAWRAR